MAPSAKNIDIDHLLHGLKDFGKFQILQYVVINVMLIPCAHILLEVVFIAYRPGYQCKNLTSSQLLRYNASDITYQKCAIELYMNPNESSVESQTIPCVNGLSYSGPVDESIVPEWDLVCSKDGLSELTQTLFTVGQSIGALIFPSAADCIGRKPIHVTCGFGLFLVATGCSLAPSYWVFALLRCLCGVFQQGMVIPGFTLSMEAFPANKRTWMACIASIWWGVCVTLLAPLAYALRSFSWRILAAVVGSMAIFSAFEFWYIHESVRWLFANDQIDKGKKILKHAAKMNGVDFDSLWIKSMELLDMTKMDEKSKEEETTDEMASSPYNSLRHNSVQIEREMIKEAQTSNVKSRIAVVTLMTNSHTRNISLVIQYSWLVVSLTYFGLYLSTSSLSADRYTNYFLTALMEIPGTIILMKTFTVYGRKKSILGMMIMAAGGLIIVSILKAVGSGSAYDISATVFSLIGMVGISGAFSGLWLYTPEIFPTNLRSASMGLASAVARIGSMLSSYTRILIIYAPWAPGLIFGGGCLIACSLFFMLPETHNKQLPQTMVQMEEWMQEKKERRNQKKLMNKKGGGKKFFTNIIYKKHPLAEPKGDNSTGDKMVPTGI